MSEAIERDQPPGERLPTRRCVPTPPRVRWREFRIEWLPRIVWLTALAAACIIWRGYVSQPVTPDARDIHLAQMPAAPTNHCAGPELAHFRGGLAEAVTRQSGSFPNAHVGGTNQPAASR